MATSKHVDFKIPNHNVTIPLLVLGEKQYMEVAQRLVWFNLEKQDWIIETEIEKEWMIEESLVVRFKCNIKDPSGKVMRVGRKTKVITEPKDYESCETGSIGRALSTLGYGTAFDKDLDEDDKDIADSPQPLKGEAHVQRPKEPVRQAPAPRDTHTSNTNQSFNPSPSRGPTNGQGVSNNGPGAFDKRALETVPSGKFKGRTFFMAMDEDKKDHWKTTKQMYDAIADNTAPAWVKSYVDYVEALGWDPLNA